MSLLNFERLLAPIDGDDPAGTNLREDFSPTAVYQQIKSARNLARAEERKLAGGDESGRPDWSPVLELAPEVIAVQSKDLEVVSWLIEALLRRHGFAGLKEGFELARRLVEDYWDFLYPRADEDGIGIRVAALAGLNGLEGADGTLIAPINSVPLTERGDAEVPFARWHYEQAASLAAMTDPDAKQARIESGAVTMEAIEKAEAATPLEFSQRLAADLGRCRVEFDQLVSALEERCGTGADGEPVAPPSSKIRAALEACHAVAVAMVGAQAPDGDAAREEAEMNAAEGGAAPASRGVVTAVRSRDEAFRALLEVARFFKETEPHSPVSYALERVVRWGRMPLPELLNELILEDGTRSDVFKLVGIPKPDDSR